MSPQLAATAGWAPLGPEGRARIHPASHPGLRSSPRPQLTCPPLG